VSKVRLEDSKVMEVFSLGDLEVTRAQISDWLKKDEDEAFKLCKDTEFTAFLNGFIISRRGKKDGPTRADGVEVQDMAVRTPAL